MVKRLLEAGAKPAEAATADKRTALHHAAARGWLDIAKMLLAAGADRAARDSQGRTPLDLALRYGNRRVADALRGTSAPAAASSPARTAALERAPKLGEAVVWYLGHMGWAVRTANHFMVFDYDGRGVPPDEPSLANGSINPDRDQGPLDDRVHHARSFRSLRAGRVRLEEDSQGHHVRRRIQAGGERGLRVHGAQGNEDAGRPGHHDDDGQRRRGGVLREGGRRHDLPFRRPLRRDGAATRASSRRSTSWPAGACAPTSCSCRFRGPVTRR